MAVNENPKNEYYKTSDGWFDYYVNIATKEKKLYLDKGDIEVDAPKLDDFSFENEDKEITLF